MGGEREGERERERERGGGGGEENETEDTHMGSYSSSLHKVAKIRGVEGKLHDLRGVQDSGMVERLWLIP